MLYINPKPIFQTRNIQNPFRFLVKSGISPGVAHRITSGEIRAIRLDHIETVCAVLNCSPNDIFNWVKDSKHELPESHPLQKLKPNPNAQNLSESFRTLPIEKLNEFAQMLIKENPPSA
jgi:DNA-binding Xre family transcriptional regulator